MIDYAALAELAEKSGFTNWAALDPVTIELKQEVRDMCAANTCGQYEKRWSCPPGCGALSVLAKTLEGKTHGILVQTVGEVEDQFDFEAMIETEMEQKEHFHAMFAALREMGEKPLAIGSGCCTKCAVCSYPESACRFPEEMVSSMEAYGMLVLEVCKANGLQYYYGSDKIAYTSCFLL